MFEGACRLSCSYVILSKTEHVIDKTCFIFLSVQQSPLVDLFKPISQCDVYNSKQTNYCTEWNLFLMKRYLYYVEFQWYRQFFGG